MMSSQILPPVYRWLLTIGTLPRMLFEALALYGTHERAGAADNPTILDWAREVGVRRDYGADAVPWCGLFVALVATRAGYALPATPLWALSWGRFGTAAPVAMLGDVLTFVRPGGGHVGLYVGEDAACYHVLGGNQSDQVGFARIAKPRLKAARRPRYHAPPATVTVRRLAATGLPSGNEA